MDSLAKVKLIKQDFSIGNYGQILTTETERTIFGELGSITRSEWSTAGSLGVQPSFRVNVYTFEYQGEQIVEIKGERYAIYRSYVRVNEDITELYLEARAGITDATDDIEEEDEPAYIFAYTSLSASGLPVYYGEAPRGAKLPYVIYELNSSNFNADDSVYSEGYDLTASLYTVRKSLKYERQLTNALNAAKLPWERGETNDLEERLYIQEYSATILGGY